MVEFPADVDIPNNYIYSERAARIIASISSCPGSQSSQTFILPVKCEFIECLLYKNNNEYIG